MDEAIIGMQRTLLGDLSSVYPNNWWAHARLNLLHSHSDFPPPVVLERVALTDGCLSICGVPQFCNICAEAWRWSTEEEART